jgi:hypothetical protein
MYLADFHPRIYSSASPPSKLSTSSTTEPAVPTAPPTSSTPTSLTPASQSENSTAQTPKVNPSASSSCPLAYPPHHEATHEQPGKTIHSTASRTLVACSTGSRHPREGRGEPEVPVQATKEATVLVADVAPPEEEAGTPRPGTGGAISLNPLQTVLTDTCRGKVAADLLVDGDMEVVAGVAVVAEEEEEEEEEGIEKKLDPVDLPTAESHEVVAVALVETEAAETREMSKVVAAVAATGW